MVSQKKIKLRSTMLLISAGLVLIIIVYFAAPSPTPYTEHRIETNEDIAKFLLSFGWQADTDHITEKQSCLPNQFDDTFHTYNNLQLQQNCDLTKFSGKEITVYTVPILNYTNTSENVLATIIVHNHRVIGGDIHSAKLDGFMHTFN